MYFEKMKQTVKTFLKRYDMLQTELDFLTEAEKLKDTMLSGLKGEPDTLPMIPTYLTDQGEIPNGKTVAVIDAGGTNFRTALVTFENNKCITTMISRSGMPGVEEPVSWDEFISTVADKIEPMMPFTDSIGFCFSYTAEITPGMDGKVICIDKEVVVYGCEGKLVGQSLVEELERRGYPGKKVVVLNDTVAVQLGGMAKHIEDGYSAAIGQVSGTGSNTCCTVPGELIKKLGNNTRNMIINFEIGMYAGLPQGYFDRLLDRQSHNPRSKIFEKMTAGVYLGELCRMMLIQASADGYLSKEAGMKAREMDKIDSSVADAWACNIQLGELAENQEQQEFIAGIARYLFERSAYLMCINLAAMLLLTGAGKEETAAVYAEGSLVEKSTYYRPELERLIEKYIQKKMGRKFQFILEHETTIAGSAAAALLNLQ